MLQLVQVALSGIPPKSTTEKEPSKKESGGKKASKHESRREAKEMKESKEQSKESKPSTPTLGIYTPIY